jgi:hypothetical protein
MTRPPSGAAASRPARREASGQAAACGPRRRCVRPRAATWRVSLPQGAQGVTRPEPDRVPKPCQDTGRTENIESELVSPADTATPSWAWLRPYGAGRSPPGLPKWPGKPAPMPRRPAAAISDWRPSGDRWGNLQGNRGAPSASPGSLVRPGCWVSLMRLGGIEPPTCGLKVDTIGVFGEILMDLASRSAQGPSLTPHLPTGRLWLCLAPA